MKFEIKNFGFSSFDCNPMVTFNTEEINKTLFFALNHILNYRAKQVFSIY